MSSEPVVTLAEVGEVMRAAAYLFIEAVQRESIYAIPPAELNQLHEALWDFAFNQWTPEDWRRLRAAAARSARAQVERYKASTDEGDS